MAWHHPSKCSRKCFGQSEGRLLFTWQSWSSLICLAEFDAYWISYELHLLFQREVQYVIFSLQTPPITYDFGRMCYSEHHQILLHWVVMVYIILHKGVDWYWSLFWVLCNSRSHLFLCKYQCPGTPFPILMLAISLTNTLHDNQQVGITMEYKAYATDKLIHQLTFATCIQCKSQPPPSWAQRHRNSLHSPTSNVHQHLQQ